MTSLKAPADAIGAVLELMPQPALMEGIQPELEGCQ